MSHIDEAVQPVADLLGDDVRYLTSSEAPGPPSDPDETQPQAIFAPVVDALMGGAQQIMLSFVAGLVATATPKLKEIGASLMARVGTRLNALIDRGDPSADRKELDEEVANAKKAAEKGDITDEELTEAEKAIVEVLKERGFPEDKAIEVAAKVRGASADLLAPA